MFNNINPPSACTQQKLLWESIISTSYEPKKPLYASYLWIYYNIDHKPLTVRLRIEKGKGKKDCLPMTYGHRVWIDKQGNKQDQMVF